MFDIFFRKSKLKSADPLLRLAALNQIETPESDLLLRLATEDPDSRVRVGAIKRISDPQLLEFMLQRNPHADARTAAAAILNDIRVEETINSQFPQKALLNLNQIAGDDNIARIAVEAINPEVAFAALKLVRARDKILECLTLFPHESVERRFLDKLRLDLMELKQLANQARSMAVRDYVLVRLSEEGHSGEAEVTSSSDGRSTATRGIALPVRRALRKYEAVCERLEQFVQDGTLPDDDTLNILFNQWNNLETIPAEFHEILLRRYNKARNDVENLRSVVASQNLLRVEKTGALREIYARLRELAKMRNLLEHRDELLKIEHIWDEGESLLDDSDPFKRQFYELWQQLVERINQNETAYHAAVEAASGCCAKLDQLLINFNPENAVRLKNEIDCEFEKILNSLGRDAESWQHKYNAIAANLASKIRNIYQERDLGRWEAYTLKCEICKELERIAELDDNNFAYEINRTKQLHERWKTLGAVPRERAGEINLRYRQVNDKIQKLFTNYFQSREAERNNIFDAKAEICAEVDQIIEIGDFESGSEKIRQLQFKWRQLGMAPTETDKKLYMRFKSSCDKFFAAKELNAKKRRQQKVEASAVKSDLCQTAEQLAENPSGITGAKIRDLWREWKEAPNAGRFESELFLRFQAALERCQASRKEYFEETVQRKQLMVQEVLHFKSQLEAHRYDAKSAQTISRMICRKYDEMPWTPVNFSEVVDKSFRESMGYVEQVIDQLRSEDMLELVRKRHGQERKLSQALETAYEENPSALLAALSNCSGCVWTDGQIKIATTLRKMAETGNFDELKTLNANAVVEVRRRNLIVLEFSKLVSRNHVAAAGVESDALNLLLNESNVEEFFSVANTPESLIDSFFSGNILPLSEVDGCYGRIEELLQGN